MPALATEDIKLLLAKRHPPDRWIYATEVLTTTGYADPARYEPFLCLRKIDAFAMALWPSLHFESVAYEIKTNRQDWLNELKNPLKRAQAYLLSNKFYFVLADGIYQRGDTPADASRCGILKVTKGGDQIREVRAAYRHAAWPMPEWFVASLLRRVRRMAEERGVTDVSPE